METEPELLSSILGTDDTRFSLNCEVNIQNCRSWSTDNRHDKKVTVWCAFTANCINRSYFFEEIYNGETLSITFTV